MKQPIRRVLVVDDEPAVRGMLTVTLRWLALKLLKQKAPHPR